LCFTSSAIGSTASQFQNDKHIQDGMVDTSLSVSSAVVIALCDMTVRSETSADLANHTELLLAPNVTAVVGFEGSSQSQGSSLFDDCQFLAALRGAAAAVDPPDGLAARAARRTAPQLARGGHLRRRQRAEARHRRACTTCRPLVGHSVMHRRQRVTRQRAEAEDELLRLRAEMALRQQPSVLLQQRSVSRDGATPRSAVGHTPRQRLHSGQQPATARSRSRESPSVVRVDEVAQRRDRISSLRERYGSQM
jgi:hypothetical protein